MRRCSAPFTWSTPTATRSRRSASEKTAPTGNRRGFFVSGSKASVRSVVFFVSLGVPRVSVVGALLCPGIGCPARSRRPGPSVVEGVAAVSLHLFVGLFCVAAASPHLLSDESVLPPLGRELRRQRGRSEVFAVLPLSSDSASPAASLFIVNIPACSCLPPESVSKRKLRRAKIGLSCRYPNQKRGVVTENRTCLWLSFFRN